LAELREKKYNQDKTGQDRTGQDRTGQDRTTKKSQKRNISHICGKATRKDIAMKFGTGVDVLEIVTCAEFDL